MMRRAIISLSAAVLASLGLTSSVAQRALVPKARYEMDVATMSGMGAAAGRGVMGGLGAMMGGGNRTAYLLEMRLGGRAAATPPPARADHFFQPAAKMGKSVPLSYQERDVPAGPAGFERPKGRLLLFWGCGARAPKGQPVVIDFAKIAAGQMPPNLWSSRIPISREVSPQNSTSYSHYPSEKEGKMPGKGSSLLGEHRIVGNHAPEIKFALTQDYMPPLDANAGMQGDGSVILSWTGIAPATGYVAWAFGGMAGPGGGNGDLVMWSSSAAREFGGGLWDWLSPETVRSLVTQKIVMPPSQTSCQIPADVKTAAGGIMMTSLNAFGPEANFAFPERPANPKTPWNIDWTAKVRFRSMSMLLVGAGMPGSEGSAPSAPARKPKPCKGPMGIPIPGTKC